MIVKYCGSAVYVGGYFRIILFVAKFRQYKINEFPEL